MSQDLYQEIILEECAHPHFFGTLSDADLIIPASNPSCGDLLTVYAKIDSATQKIVELRWDGQGCAISMSAMSVLAQKIMDQHPTFQEIANWTQQDIEKLLGLEEITTARVKCLLLGLSTLQNLLTNPT